MVNMPGIYPSAFNSWTCNCTVLFVFSRK